MTGLTGLPDAITSVFPDTVVQTCVVHVIRNAMRFVSYQDRKKIATSMRTIYTAPTVEAAELALKDLDAEWGRQHPGVTDVWRRAWAGSSGALPRRSPLRTGRAGFPRTSAQASREGVAGWVTGFLLCWRAWSPRWQEVCTRRVRLPSGVPGCPWWVR